MKCNFETLLLQSQQNTLILLEHLEDLVHNSSVIYKVIGGYEEQAVSFPKCIRTKDSKQRPQAR
jgi:hypothetical protein